MNLRLVSREEKVTSNDFTSTDEVDIIILIVKEDPVAPYTAFILTLVSFLTKFFAAHLLTQAKDPVANIP